VGITSDLSYTTQHIATLYIFVGKTVAKCISACWELFSLCTSCGGTSVYSFLLKSLSLRDQALIALSETRSCTSSFFLRLTMRSPSRTGISWSPMSFLLSSRLALSLHNRDGSSIQHSSTKALSSQSAVQQCNTTHQRQSIASKHNRPVCNLPNRPQRHPHQPAQHSSTAIPSSPSAEHYRNTTHERQHNHILKAKSDPTIDHDRPHNDYCDSLCGVLPCDHLGQVFSDTLGAAECRRWQQVQPLEAQVPARKVPHNRPTCAA